MTYYCNTEHHRSILLIKVLFSLLCSPVKSFIFSSLFLVHLRWFFYKRVLDVLLFRVILGTFSNGEFIWKGSTCQYFFVMLWTQLIWVQIGLHTSLEFRRCGLWTDAHREVCCWLFKRELVLLEWYDWLPVVRKYHYRTAMWFTSKSDLRSLCVLHEYFTLNVFDFKPKHCVVANECHIYCVFSVF